MSSTSAAERAATSGPKTQDSNPHVATPDPHATPVKPPTPVMQVAIAKETVVDNSSVIRSKLYTHFEGRVDQSVISDYLSLHAGQEVKFFEVAHALSENAKYMSELTNAQSHLEVISEFLTAYPQASTSAELWEHIYPGPREQPLSPVPGIVTTTKKTTPQSSLAAAVATDKRSMPPPQNRTPSKQLNSDFAKAGYWNQMNGAVQIEDIDRSPTTQADDTGMLCMEDREKAIFEKETSRQKTLEGGEKIRVVTEKGEQEDGWSMSSFGSSIASNEGSRRSQRSTPSKYRQQGAQPKDDW